MNIQDILKDGYNLKDIIKQNNFFMFVFVKKGYTDLYLNLKEMKGGLKE